MRKVTEQLNSLVWNQETARFLVVGSIGFVVNAAVLTIFHRVVGLSILPAEIIAVEAAIMATFLLHHNWTYRNFRHKPILLRFATFNLSALSGAVITVLSLWLLTEYLQAFYLLGLVIGAGLAVAWNFGMNKLIVWSPKSRSVKKR